MAKNGCKLPCPFDESFFCSHTEQVFSRCGVFGLLESGDTLIEDVRQALQTFCRGLAIFDLEVGIIVIPVCFQYIFSSHQIHIGLGEITLERHEWTMVGGHLHQDRCFLSWRNNDIRESHSLNTHSHFASQPKGNLHLQGAIIGKWKPLVEAFPHAQWCETTHIEIQVHASLIAQHLHLDGGHTLIDFRSRQGLVFSILHVFPLVRQLKLLLGLSVTDIPELEIIVIVALQEVHLLGVERHRLEVQRQVSHSAFGHPEKRIELNVKLLLIRTRSTRDGILLAVRCLHERLFGKPNPRARSVVGIDVQHRLRLLQLHLRDFKLSVTISHKGRWFLPHNLFLCLPHNAYEGKQHCQNFSHFHLFLLPSIFNNEKSPVLVTTKHHFFLQI